MTKRFILLCGVLAALALSSGDARAAAPQTLGKFGFWSAFSVTDGGHPVCYMSLTAKPPEQPAAGKKGKRGNVVLMITHRPAEGSLDVFSYTAGLKFKPASEVTADVGGKSLSLFTKDDTAWSRDSMTDHALVAALRGAPSIKLTGLTSIDTRITDTIALKGAAEAYRAIGKACGQNVEEPKAAKPAAKPAAKLAPKKSSSAR